MRSVNFLSLVRVLAAVSACSDGADGADGDYSGHCRRSG